MLNTKINLKVWVKVKEDWINKDSIVNKFKMQKYKIIKNAKDKLEGADFMLRQMAWNTFKHTGNVNTFIELIEIENIQKHGR